MHTTSKSAGTPRAPPAPSLASRSARSACPRSAASREPTGRPSRRIQRCLPPAGTPAKTCPLGSQMMAPMLLRTWAMAAPAPSSGRRVTMRHFAERWFKRPHGEPSGVCTGQRNPQVSGSNFRTVVVFISAKYCPRWIAAKCELNRAWLSLSATMVYPDDCIRSKPLREFKLPVAMKLFSRFATSADIWTTCGRSRGMLTKSCGMYFAFFWPSCLLIHFRMIMPMRPKVTSRASLSTTP
mmetsp:Transcript_70617/g.216407  ORF Transcript_70617/g.216407 Transcript_70617/m.216407 type:complete len:239 (-) Transcript_70617:1206-1922(-)